MDLGVNFIDTAAVYGTEDVVGQALLGLDRESVVVSSKAQIRNGAGLRSAPEVVASLEKSLRLLRVDTLDVFQLHAVVPETYPHARDVIVPALLRERDKGKLRFLGITESPPNDPAQAMLPRALDDDCWDVVMVGFHMLNQQARRKIFPKTQANKVGTLLMFVVRNLFSRPGLLEQTFAELSRAGRLPPQPDDPLGFLIHVEGARSVIDAAYRYARHEPGADVILFGTGNAEHVVGNVAAILRGPLPSADREHLAELFGHLEGVGLDLPDQKP